MIVIDCIQGSPEWEALRLGVVTASAVGQILTPERLQPSKQRRGYLCQLVAETILRRREDSFGGSEWTERGLELEGEALDAFALVTSVDTWRVGFVFRDESRRCGFSPDFMCEGAHGELKCPMAKTHIGYLLDGGVPSAYRGQLQFGLWCTGYERAWFMSYYPGLDPLIVEVEPEPDYQAALDEHVPAFIAELDETLAKLARGRDKEIET